MGLLDEALAGAADRDERRAEALRGLWRRDPSRIRSALGAGAAPLVQTLELFGGKQVPEEAARSPLPERARKAAGELAGIARVLEELGLSDRFRFDLAELRGFDYYTGLIFEIHAPGAGGRYDEIGGPAVGFSLSVDRPLPRNDLLANFWPPASGRPGPPERGAPSFDSLPSAELPREVHPGRGAN